MFIESISDIGLDSTPKADLPKRHPRGSGDVFCSPHFNQYLKRLFPMGERTLFLWEREPYGKTSSPKPDTL